MGEPGVRTWNINTEGTEKSGRARRKKEHGKKPEKA
jgi:hypothetical protein